MTSEMTATRWSVDQVSRLTLHCLLVTQETGRWDFPSLMAQVQTFFILETRMKGQRQDFPQPWGVQAISAEQGHWRSVPCGD